MKTGKEQHETERQIIESDMKALQDLETDLGKSLEIVDAIAYDHEFCVYIMNKRVTGMGIANSRLTTLPDSFGDLDSLKMLSLYENKITVLPDSFEKLR